jgi:hypothetical protein
MVSTLYYKYEKFQPIMYLVICWQFLDQLEPVVQIKGQLA